MFQRLMRVLAVLLFIQLTTAIGYSATYTLTVNTNGSGSVSRNPTNSVYPGGSTVTLTALPADGWAFSSWSGDATGSSNPINVTMDANKSVTATFTQLPTYTLTTNVIGQGSISLDPPGGSYRSGSTVTATANPAPNWRFNGWSGAATGTANPVSVVMDGNKTLTAEFVEPARITQQPQSITRNPGETAQFSVQGSGNAPVTYQWHFNGAPVAGATSSNLTINNVQPQNAGSYTATASNAYGGQLSQPAQLTVTGGCTGSNTVTACNEAALRSAMANGGTVTFCCNGTITLSSPITVTNDVTLDGTAHNVTISGGGSVQLFRVAPGARFEARHLTLADGRITGVQGTASNETGGSGQGGAIFNQGVLNLTECVLSNNFAIGGQGRINRGDGGPGEGGAIYSLGGQVTLRESMFMQNGAIGGRSDVDCCRSSGFPGGAAGGAINVNGGSLFIAGGTLVSNRTDTFRGGLFSRGGAVYLNAAQVLASNVQFTANEAVSANGGSNTGEKGTSADCEGGAIYLESHTARVSYGTFTRNLAAGGAGSRRNFGGQGNGGAVYSKGTLMIDHSSFRGNSGLTGAGGTANPGFGGALFNAGHAVVNESTLSSNMVAGGAGGFAFIEPFLEPYGSGWGGAVFNSGTLAMTNSSVVGNSASAGLVGLMSNSGTPGDAIGGGIATTNGSVTLINVTVAGNLLVLRKDDSGVEEGNARGANLAQAGGIFTVRNSLVAYPGTRANAFGTITDGGYNISSDGSAGFSSGTSFNFTDPKLGPLQNNGGPTETMALQNDSPALDFGTAVGAPSTDQRGSIRPSGPGVDIGAFEQFVMGNTNAAPPALTTRISAEFVRIEFQAAPYVTYELQESTTLTNWSLRQIFGPYTNAQTVGMWQMRSQYQHLYFRVKMR